MKHLFISLAIFSTLFLELHAFEAGQLSLDTPTALHEGDAAFTLRHRFYGDITESENFFGIDDGGNAFLQLRYSPLEYFVIETHHTRDNHEYNIALSYNYDFDVIKVAYALNGLSITLPQFKERQYSYFGNLSLQSPNYFDHLIISANLGYDGFYEKSGTGLGIDINMANFIGALSFTERLSLMAEYYPQFSKKTGINGIYDSFAAGIKFQTYAHHFEILISNSTAMDARTMMLGTNDTTLHFGFNINRKF